MNIRSLALVLCASLSLGVACKKKPAPETTPSFSAPPPAPAPAPAAAPPQVQQMVRNFQKVYFELDSASLNSESKAALDENVRIMQQYTDIKLEVQGHADERGTTEYNLALGQRRGQAVRTYLVNSGIPASRLKVVSYGEERPAVSGSYETAWDQNRRTEFLITWGATDEVRGTVN